MTRITKTVLAFALFMGICAAYVPMRAQAPAGKLAPAAPNWKGPNGPIDLELTDPVLIGALDLHAHLDPDISGGGQAVRDGRHRQCPHGEGERHAGLRLQDAHGHQFGGQALRSGRTGSQRSAAGGLHVPCDRWWFSYLQRRPGSTVASLSEALSNAGIRVGGKASLRERVGHELNRLKRQHRVNRSAEGKYSLSGPDAADPSPGIESAALSAL